MKKKNKINKKSVFHKYDQGGYFEPYQTSSTKKASQTIGSTLSSVPVPGAQALGASVELMSNLDSSLKDEYGVYKNQTAGALNTAFNKVSNIEGIANGEDVGRNVASLATFGLSEGVNTLSKAFGVKDGIFGKSDAQKKREKLQKEEFERKKAAGVTALDKFGSANYQQALISGIQGNQDINLMAKGGTVKSLSNNSVEFNGASHEQGGIVEPIVKGQPLTNAEVEGGETGVKQPDNSVFIFSEELGFAQKHKPIAKAIGKVEKQLQLNNNPASINTLNRLKQQEENLKIQQEEMKSKLGIPSDLDKKKYGGLLNKLSNIPSSDRTTEGNLKFGKGGKLKYAGGGLASLASYAPDIAGLGVGLWENMSNKALIKERQKLLDNMPDQQLTSFVKPELVTNNYNPAIRENSLFQKSLNQNFSNPQIAASNKLAAQGKLIDSINENESQTNRINTQLKNQAIYTNNDIQTKNNEITINNALRRIGGQDDIIRDKSTNNAQFSQTLGNTIQNMSQRKLGQDQKLFDFMNSDPKVQKQIARNSPESLNFLGKKTINDLAYPDEDINNITSKIKINYNDKGNDYIKKHGGVLKYPNGGTVENKDVSILPGQYNSDVKAYLLDKAKTNPETAQRLQQAEQLWANTLIERDPEKYEEITHQKWGVDQGYINKLNGQVTQKGLQAGYNLRPNLSKVRTSEYNNQYNQAFAKGDSLIKKQIELGTYKNPDAPVYNWLKKKAGK